MCAQYCLTLCKPMDCNLARFLCPWDSPGKNTRVGCHFLLQGSFQPRGQTCVSCISSIGRWSLYHWVTYRYSKEYLLQFVVSWTFTWCKCKFCLLHTSSSQLLCVNSRNSVPYTLSMGSPGGSVAKNPPVMQEMWVRSLGQEDPLEKEMASHSSIPPWEIPWTEEPGGLQSMGSQRVRHNWLTENILHIYAQKAEKWTIQV